MTYLVMAFILLVSVVLQIGFSGYAILGSAKIPFLMSVVLYYALSRNSGVMVVAAACAGFLNDALSGVPLGYSSLLFCVMGWVVSRFRDYVIMDSLLTSVFFGGIAGFVLIPISYIMLAREGLAYCSLGFLVLKMIGTGLLAMLCTPLLFALGRMLDQLVGNVDIKEDLDVIEY